MLKDKNTYIGILSRRPLVLSGWWYSGDFVEEFEPSLRALSGLAATVVIFSGWSVAERFRNRKLAGLREKLLPYLNRGQIAVIFAANDECECSLYRAHGLDACVLNHNAFFANTDNHLYSCAKKYSFIYNAQIVPYKRHHLTSKLGRGVIVYAGADKDYLNRLHAGFFENEFPNGDPRRESYRRLTFDEISRLCAKSKVGVCLSHTEGAMLASVEYLLAGIPVVSTYGLGGREALFDPRFSRVVQDDPDTIAQAADELSELSPDPFFVRASALQIIYSYRLAAFRTLLDHLAKRRIRFDEGELAMTIFKNRSFAAEGRTSAELAQVLRS